MVFAFVIQICNALKTPNHQPLVRKRGAEEGGNEGQKKEETRGRRGRKRGAEEGGTRGRGGRNERQKSKKMNSDK
jgi:hypothetical protein